MLCSLLTFGSFSKRSLFLADHAELVPGDAIGAVHSRLIDAPFDGPAKAHPPPFYNQTATINTNNIVVVDSLDEDKDESGKRFFDLAHRAASLITRKLSLHSL